MMLQIEFEPTLSSCVETEARREYRAAMRELLATGKDDKQLGEKLETLRLFLETMDFKQLRRESEKYLTEGRRVGFTVYQEGGTVKYDLRII